MSIALDPLEILRRKRDGETLTPAEIVAFVSAVVQRRLTDPQIAAWLMAVYLRGLDGDELAALTTAMRDSGATFDWRPLHTVTVDKHSTGGVGDKTSLLLGPIVAAAGLAARDAAGVPGICVPMISGRALGHTGGTLDKLESIPGFNTRQAMERVEALLRRNGAALIGQTAELVPADRILYALRDHTGTVESPYLITASIMSKKLAEDLDALVLDVKTGSGAFLKTDEAAHELARLLVETGEAAGVRTVALLTRMDEPLGRYAGNWLEVLECVDVLQDRRHALSRDLVELTLALAGWMLHLAGARATPEAGAAYADELLTSGAAYQAWLAIVAGQGGDTSIFKDVERFHQVKARRVLTAASSGYLRIADCTQVGLAVQRLGAGRSLPDETVSAHAGIEVHAKTGDAVTAGQPLVTLFADEERRLDLPYSMLEDAYRITPERAAHVPSIRQIVRSARRG